MNRQQRRREERLEQWLRSLPKEKINIINDYAKGLSEKDLFIYCEVQERVLRVMLNDIFQDVIEAEEKLSEFIELITAEGTQMRILREKEGVDYRMTINKERDLIIEEYIKMRKEGIRENKIITDLCFKYNKLTKTAVKNIILDHKKEEREKAENKDTEELAKYILGEEVVKKETKKKEIKENKEEKKENETMTMKNFKIKKEEVIKKVEFEGNNGTYKGETGLGLELESNGVKLAFTSVKDLEKFYAEYRQAFSMI